ERVFAAARVPRLRRDRERAPVARDRGRRLAAPERDLAEVELAVREALAVARLHEDPARALEPLLRGGELPALELHAREVHEGGRLHGRVAELARELRRPAVELERLRDSSREPEREAEPAEPPRLEVAAPERARDLHGRALVGLHLPRLPDAEPVLADR